MKDWERDSVQPGWAVYAADGQELGTVVGADANELRIRKPGFLGGEISVPKSAVDEVEPGHVELSLTKAEAEHGGR